MKHTLHCRVFLLGCMLLLGRMATAQVQTKTVYDDDGDCLEVREYYTDDTTKLSRTDHYVYAVGGELAAIVYYKYSKETGQVESHGVKTFRRGLIIGMTENSADEQLLCKAHYRYYRNGRSKGYKIVHFHDDGTQNTTHIMRRYKKDRCYEKTYIDGKLCYSQNYDAPHPNPLIKKHIR